MDGQASPMRRLLPWFGLVLLVLAVDAALCVYAVDRFEDKRQQRRQVEAFVDQSRNVLSVLKDAETGERGYIITGEERFLEPFHAAEEVVDIEVAALLAMAAQRGPAVHAEVEQLTRWIATWMTFLRKGVDTRRTVGEEAARNYVATGQGKDQMDAVRAAVGSLVNGENAVIEHLAKQTSAQWFVVQLTFWIALALAMAAVVTLWIGMRSDRVFRSRAAATQREGDRRLRDIANNSGLVIYSVRNDGRVDFANWGLGELLGDTPIEVEGRSSVAREDGAETAGVPGRLVASHFGVAEEVHVPQSGPHRGQERTFHFFRFPLRNDAGDIAATCGVGTDITDRVVAERALRHLTATLEDQVANRTAALEDANRELEAFAYTVSHDLRAPLRGIQGFAEALREDFPAEISPTAKDYLRRIAAAGARTERLIEDLLEYARLSRTQVEMSEVDLEEAVQTAVEQTRPQLDARSGTIEVRGPLPSIRAHRAVLVQVLENLLANAIKFIAPEVQPNIVVKPERLENGVRLWVVDNGIGIAPEHIDRVFNVFERLHGQETYPGTGIGLAIVRKGVERMGGRVGVESVPGSGSSFFVELPRAQPRGVKRFSK